METSRREFLITGASAVAVSAGILKSVQGWLGTAQQYAGIGLKRSMDGPIVPPASEEVDAVAHALNRLSFGPVPGDYARVSALGVEGFVEEQLAAEKIDD